MIQKHLACLMSAFLAGASFITVPADQVAAQIPSHPVPAKRVVFVIDCSGSMKGQRIEAAKQGAKLGIAIIDGNAGIIPFSSSVGSAMMHHLASAADRLRAMADIDRLVADGGTNYPSAVATMRGQPRDTIFVFISDGANEVGTPQQVLEAVADLGPIYTIAVQTTDAARQLLTDMALATGGTACRVESAQALTEALVEISQRISDYRAYEPRDQRIKFQNCVGTLIPIGYANVPSTTGAPPSSFHHDASLTARVVLDRHYVHEPSDIVIQVGQVLGTNPRLARILLQGLPTDRMEIKPNESVFATNQVMEVAAVFQALADHQAKATFELADEHGRIVTRADGKPSPDGDRFEASLRMPTQEGVYQIKSRTAVTLDGKDFLAEKTRSVFVKKPDYLGLVDLPMLDFGRQFPGQKVRLGESIIYSKDVDKKVTYAAVFPQPTGVSEVRIQGGHADISPLTSSPARLPVFADLSHALPGTYAGEILYCSRDVRPPRTWRQQYQFIVAAPIEARPIEFGNARPGQRLKSKLVLLNRSRVARTVQLAAQRFQSEGGSILLKLPEKVTLAAESLTEVPVELAVSPVLRSQGQHETILEVHDGGRLSATAKVSVDIGGQGQPAFVASPKHPKFEFSSSRPVKFSFSLVALPEFQGPDVLMPTLEWESGIPATTRVIATLDQKHGLVVRDESTIQVSGVVMVRGGSDPIAGTVHFQSRKNASFSVPVTLVPGP